MLSLTSLTVASLPIKQYGGADQSAPTQEQIGTSTFTVTMASPTSLARGALVLQVLVLQQLSLICGQAVYPTNLCGFPGPDEDLPIQCFFTNDDGTPKSVYGCCPAKNGCCGSEDNTIQLASAQDRHPFGSFIGSEGELT